MKNKVLELLKSLETRDMKPVSYINKDKYIQHNLVVEDGLEGFGKFLQSVPSDAIKVNTIRVFQDGDYVFTHSDYIFFGSKVGFDIFKFEDGLIVEHWDNLQEKTDKNPSGRTQLDGELEIKDLDKTEENKKIIKDLLENVFIGGEYENITKYISNKKYIQHNSAIGDGLQEMGSKLADMVDQGMPMVYSKNHKILGEGNFVLSISEGEFQNKNVSFYDLFRLENGLVVEHWDIIEEILDESKWKNKNGKFGF